jgi:hypothetical protein
MSTTTCVHIPESVTTEAGPALLERPAFVPPSATPGHSGHPGHPGQPGQPSDPGLAERPAPRPRRVVRTPGPAAGPAVVPAEWAKRAPWMPPNASASTAASPLSPGRTAPFLATVPAAWTTPRPTRPEYGSPRSTSSSGTGGQAPWTRSATGPTG